MIVRRDERDFVPIQADGAVDLGERWLLRLGESGSRFDIRTIRIEAGGTSTLHAHPWEQANYIVQGRGRVVLGDRELEVAAGDFVYVPGNVQHKFVNSSRDELLLLAIRGPSVEPT